MEVAVAEPWGCGRWLPGCLLDQAEQRPRIGHQAEGRQRVDALMEKGNPDAHVGPGTPLQDIVGWLRNRFP